MVMSLKKHYASEKRDLDYCISKFFIVKENTKELLEGINNYFKLSGASKILEIGAAQGNFIAACELLGYSCQGIEPYEPAIKVSQELSKRLNIKMEIKKGIAENIPYDDNTFDLVIANSVMEHVRDVEKVFNEIVRVLKPTGAFYFVTTSILCPKQDEIRLFPFFSWYPQETKIKIMNWAICNKPSLVGYTETPAINWFSSWETRKKLEKLGFVEIYDRWDLINTTFFPFHKRITANMFKKNKITKIFADILVPGCGYLALKK